MKITTLTTAGIDCAIHAMRNPMNSWDRCDSTIAEVGPKDKELSLTLQNAGPEHCKHLRMIVTWADITAPRFWWSEADTYRAGVEKVSCSTMHKLMSRPLNIDDFEHEDDPFLLKSVIRSINRDMEVYKELKKEGEDEQAKEIWRGIIQILPQSYLQKRTVMFSYAALRNIVKQRKGHKLKEWAQFIEWAESLPESWMIFE